MPVTRRSEAVTSRYRSNTSYPNVDTPKKARLFQAIEGFERRGPTETTPCKQRIFDRLGVSPSTAYHILATGTERRIHGRDGKPDPRGRPSKLSPEDIKRLEDLITTFGRTGRHLTWNQLAYEADMGVTGLTIRRAMGSLNYSRCIACRRSWVSPMHAERRVDYATRMLQEYPTQKDWHRVRFSDEVHFSYGPEGRMSVTKKPGERYCFDCIQPQPEPEEEDKLRIHAWGAVGYEFKSELHWYDLGNRNGKMKADYYCNTILETVVKPWIEAGDDFILEEDQDSAHGLPRGGKGIVQTWKRQHGLKHMFNCSGSPDLSPIENAWQPFKQSLARQPHWDECKTREIVAEAWYDKIGQTSLNNWVDSVPQRLQQVIEGNGEMTKF